MPVNRGVAAKKKMPRGKPWPKGVSGNPKGAPRRGESWAEIIRMVGEMDGPSIAKWWDTKAREFKGLPVGVNVKTLIVISAFASLMREFSPSIWREIIDRADGPGPDTVILERRERENLERLGDWGSRLPIQTVKVGEEEIPVRGEIK